MFSGLESLGSSIVLVIKPGRACKFVSNLLLKLSGFLLIFQGSILLLPQSSIKMYLKNVLESLDKREELMEHSPAKNLFTAIVVPFSVSHMQLRLYGILSVVGVPC